ncbi:MAG: pyridoxamine 5'-phosphate oxidase family protein [Deltaproteobacteria bacterium]|nr:pyridoxamine 5'-phosphate oxidase family protein [Deltaproteobacteria bacterium]MCL5277137.1 pyridoxamine 5'-phosphate oxidase family protein [Deltaproteobacteria bacterium]
MAKLTQEMKDLIAAQQCFVATVNADGTPNIGPKRSTRVIDDEHIAYNEATAKQTWSNVNKGSKVAIAVVDREKLKGFRFTGTPEIVTSGKLYEDAAGMAQKSGRPAPKAVINIRIEKIFNLGIPGAGEQLV